MVPTIVIRQLTPASVVAGLRALRLAGALPYQEGLFHAECGFEAMAALLSVISEANAVARGLVIERLKDGSKRVQLDGIRWDVNNRYKVTRLFGPTSDPDETVEIEST